MSFVSLHCPGKMVEVRPRHKPIKKEQQKKKKEEIKKTPRGLQEVAHACLCVQNTRRVYVPLGKMGEATAAHRALDRNGNYIS